MKLVIVADTFPPKLTSSAAHLFDLATFLKNKGHKLTVLTTDDSLFGLFSLNTKSDFNVLRARIPDIRDGSSLRRLLIELSYPYYLYKACKKSKIRLDAFDGIIWWSPSIFFGLFIFYLKYKSQCKAYLVLRDIFPTWAFDLKLISKFTRLILNAFALLQYRAADCIGVNSPSSKVLLEKHHFLKDKCEVLWTWLPPYVPTGNTRKRHSKRNINFIYSGNMGVAQKIFLFGELAKKLEAIDNIKFSFYGRGSDRLSFKNFVSTKKLLNIKVHNEVSQSDLKKVFLESDVGIVSLNIRHTTSNIPGKFLSYMEAGIPVLAKINPGNDLIDLISKYDVGVVVTTECLDDLVAATKELCHKIKTDPHISSRCKGLAKEVFSIDHATHQMLALFSSEG